MPDGEYAYSPLKMDLKSTLRAETIAMLRKRLTEDGFASPAPSYLSMTSEQSVDGPGPYSGERSRKLMKLEAASPAPSYSSVRSDHSIIPPTALPWNYIQAINSFKFSQRDFSRNSFETPCASLKSDPSLDRPMDRPETIPSPCLSCRSNQSMGLPIKFRKGSLSHFIRPKEIPSPCLSYASDQSMGLPIKFRERASSSVIRPKATRSPCLSYASDQSMGLPIKFREGAFSPVLRPKATRSPCLSYASDQSMGLPIKFREGAFSPVLSERQSSLLLTDLLRCSVCKDVLREPMSIPCGHSFCKICIHKHWSSPAHGGGYSCPHCRKTFKTRPDLNLNCVLANMVQALQDDGFSPALPARSYAEPGDVACDLCPEQKIRAVKSCLTCCLSYCESHVKHHYTVPVLQRHTLSEVTGELKQRICPLHHRALEVFCKTDQTFICVACAIEEHNGHETVLPKCEASGAEKLCLTCEVSYCEIHTRQHYTVPSLQKRKLVDATKDLEQRDHQEIPYSLMAQTKRTKLLNYINELTTKLEKAEMAMTYFTKSFYRGFEESSDLAFVEVAALGRQLDVGMLYDCRSDSFSSDVFLWDQETVYSMRMSVPRFQRDLKILEVDTLQERLKALDLTLPVRASVLSGLIEPAGAAAFLNHPTQPELQGRVTLYSRTSTRLDLLSHSLLYSGSNLSGISLTKATHVVMAVLYGTQASFVFDDKHGKSENTMKDVAKKMTECSCKTELLSSLNENEKESCLSYDCTLYIDGEVSQRRVNFDTVVNVYSSLQKSDDSQTAREVPLKVWLYPLKNLDQSYAYVVKDISEGHLFKAEKVLDNLQSVLSVCQRVISSSKSHDVVTWFPGLEDALLKFFSLLERYHSEFKRKLAFCIKNIREKGGEKEEKSLQDLLDSHDQSPFNSHNRDQWLQNKVAEVKALNECRSANITIIKLLVDLQRIIADSQADRVLCFTLSSLEVEDPYLSALTHHVKFMNIKITTESLPPFTVPDTSQKILSDLKNFLSHKEKENKAQHIMFIAASIADPVVPGSCVRLYQSGSLVSGNVRLDVKPEPPKITGVQQTRVTLKLQSSKNQKTKRYRVEYREATEGTSPVFMKWTVIEMPCTEEICVISGLAPETKYQLRYAVMDSKEMSDYSTITEVQTIPVPKPGPPTVFNQNKDSHFIAWQNPEAELESVLVCYKLDYMEAGLEGWQSIQTDGPECEYTITVPYSTCYKARVSAVYADGNISSPSEETKVPLRGWSVDLSKRKASILLEVLKHQTGKKSVKIRDCTDEESEVRSFLQCLPYISKLRFEQPLKRTEPPQEWRKRVRAFLLNLCLQAVTLRKAAIQDILDKLRYFKTNREESVFLLDLYSHLKDYEIQTGSSVLPALRPVYQSVPAVWSINFLETKASLFLEVLKLQTNKKPVEITGWTEGESETRSLLQCLQYISELSFIQQNRRDRERRGVRTFLLDLCLQAALRERETIQAAVEKCILPRFKSDKGKSSFLLELYSHVKDYEAQTGQSVLPALQHFYQFVPGVWSVSLSETKSSLLLEVLKLQMAKTAVELRGITDDEREVRNLLQCLPYISELRFHPVLHGRRKKCSVVVEFLLKLVVAAAERDAETGQSFSELLASACSFQTFCVGEDEECDNAPCDVLLDLYLRLKNYEAQTGRSIVSAYLPVYQKVPEVWSINLSDKKVLLLLELMKLQMVKKPVVLTGWLNVKRKVRSFVQCLPYISQLRLCSNVILRMKKARCFRFGIPATLEELSLVQSTTPKPHETPIRILNVLASLLRLCNVKCLNLTEYKTEAEPLMVLLNPQGPEKIRFSEETLQDLAAVVYEAQEEEVTRCFLQKVGGDLISCSLTWEKIHYFQKYHTITVDFRKSSINPENVRDLLPVLDRVQFRRLTSSFLLSLLREIHETRSSRSVPSLLSSLENCISLNSRMLNSSHCATLRYTLQHCTAVSLNLRWTTIPEEELKSIVPLLKHVTNLSVDRLLLLKLLHCCSVPELHQETSVLLSALQNHLDFSCQSILDLTADTPTHTLSLSAADCRVISTSLQRAQRHTQLTLQDCEVEEAGVEQLFSMLHQVKLSCTKAVLLHFLTLLRAENEAQLTRRAAALAKALGNDVDLSDTHLNLSACTSLALVLENSEGLAELDLSRCQLSDRDLEPLLPHLHKVKNIDLSHNDITDASARKLQELVSVNSNIQTVSLFSNRMTDLSPFHSERRFEIW